MENNFRLGGVRKVRWARLIFYSFQAFSDKRQIFSPKELKNETVFQATENQDT